MSYSAEFLDEVHEHCFGNEEELRASSNACCIACVQTFDTSLVEEWTRQTGWCPVCTFDTLVGDASGYPIAERDFVLAMNKKFFQEPLGSEEAWKELHAQN